MAARGEVWSCAFPDIGRRPLVVLSRNAVIPRLRRTLVAPCTTTIRGQPSEVILDPSADPIPRQSAVNPGAVGSVAIAVLEERIGRLGDVRMNDVWAALEIAVGCGR